MNRSVGYRLRRRSTLALFSAALLGLGMLSTAREARTCSCAPNPSPQEALFGASAVFVATVVAVEGSYPVPTNEDSYGPGGRAFRMNVLGAWKGVEHRQVVVTTGSGGGDCGYDFTVGETYLVYGQLRHPGGETVSTNICTRTRRWAGATEDSVALGKPTLSLGSTPFRSPSRCPIHTKIELRPATMAIMLRLPPLQVAEYRRLRSERFPFAGLLIDAAPTAPHDAGERFRDPNHGLVCTECRARALDWCRRHSGRKPGSAD